MRAPRLLILCCVYILSQAPLCGQLLFHKNLSSVQEDYPEHSIALPDGGIAICGTVITQSPYSSIMFLTRLDSNGTQLWTKYYSATQARATKLFPAYDGGFYIGGYSLFGWNGWNATLTRTDPLGNIIWSRQSAPGAVADVKRTSDGGFIFVGQVIMTWSTVAVIKTDSLGFTEWSKAYFRDDASVALGVEQTYEGGYLVTGRTNSFGYSSNAAMFVMNIDSTGTVLFNRVLTGATPSGYGREIIRNDRDSTYAIACNVPGLSLIILKRNLSLLSARSYAPSFNGEAQELSLTTDGGFLYTSQNAGHTCVMKIDSVGNSVWYKYFDPVPNLFGLSCFSAFQNGNDIYWSTGTNTLNNGDISVCRFNAHDTQCDSFSSPSDWSLSLNVLDSLFAVTNIQRVDTLITFNEQPVLFGEITSCLSLYNSIGETESTPEEYPFPVPANEYITVNADKGEQFELYDALGKRVLYIELENGSNQVDVSAVREGIYIYTISGVTCRSGRIQVLH